MSLSRLLIVDDDAEIRHLIAMYAEENQYVPIEAEDGETALRQLQAHQPDLVLLDIAMPGMDGLIVCRRMRELSNVPIIFLTSKWENKDIVQGLEAGGDDYIIKPFHPDVLLARIKANLRRSKMDRKLVFGELTINCDTYEARFRGNLIPFSAKEIKLLMYLAERPRHIFHVEHLYAAIWGSWGGDVRTVMVHISTIRQKLLNHAPDTVKIETVKGIGYRFVP